MLRIPGRAVTYGELWFEESCPEPCGVDIMIHRQVAVPVPCARTSPFLSLTTGLGATKDALHSQLHLHCRQQIRRADKDGLRMEFVRDPEHRLDEFTAFYDTFAQQKSVWLSDRTWLSSACQAGQLVLTSAWQGDEAMVWHAYLLAGAHVRLQYSGSWFRDKGSAYRSLVGRANRWLHWQDILQFKELGIDWYDWGGLFEDASAPERAGINDFKNSFGGVPVRSFDCTVPLTVRGRIWLPLRDAWRGLNTPHPATIRGTDRPGAAPSDSNAAAG